MSRVVLAYSGGLYTTACVHWLRYEHNMQVLAYSGDLGQVQRPESMCEDALDAGADSADVGDLREAFISDFIFPALRAHARYESGYLLGTALSRPLLAKELVRIAREEGCECIAHTSSNVRNDAVRFTRCIHSLAPDIKVICPPDIWRMKTRADVLTYAKRFNLPWCDSENPSIDYDRNIWGGSIRPAASMNVWSELSEEMFQMTAQPLMAPDRPTVIEIEFDHGVPIALNGPRIGPLELIARLNKLGGDNGVGRIDSVEEDIFGRKTREIYEAPAAEILYKAHSSLENLVMRLSLIRCKEMLAHEYATIIYSGAWFEPLRECLDAFFERSQEVVTGKVRLRLFKGACAVIGMQSPFALTDTPGTPEAHSS